MSSSGERLHASWVEQPPTSVQWRVWPMCDCWYKGVTGVVALLLGVWGVYVLVGATHLALGAGAAVLIAAWRFFAPITYELNNEGVHQRTFGRYRRILWNEIHRYETDPGGILLLPFRDVCALDAARGLYLPWREKAGEVLAVVHYYLDSGE